MLLMQQFERLLLKKLLHVRGVENVQTNKQERCKIL
jgi:hypothetical protein